MKRRRRHHESRLLTLVILAEGPSYGVKIARDSKRFSPDHPLFPTAMSQILNALERERLVRTIDYTAHPGGGVRRNVELTAAGEAVLELWKRPDL